MYQVKVRDEAGLECYCSDGYHNEKQARAVFRKKFPDAQRLTALVINSHGYTVVAEKPAGLRNFRRV